MKIAFIGLGVMGFPMAGHLANAGYDVCVFNRTQEKAERWLNAYKGRAASTPALAAKYADVVLLCVGNDDDVRNVTYGENGVFSQMKSGSTLIDHTTTSAGLARELYSAATAQGLSFLDAPVSGGQAGAENAKLTIMLGGEEASYSKASKILDVYAVKHALMGNAGNGQLTKMVNQICIAGVVQGLSEALHFAQQADLDTSKVIDVISKGAAQSWQMENRASTMVKNAFDFGFAVDWMRKDLGFVLDEAKQNNSRLPITALVDQFYAQVQANGGGRYDTSSLISLLNKGSHD
ncbi:NAD(P)-dependent oxidoreductase [Agaribacter marinus]|uniref:Oxidoreductase n=1 Tax=Agaribacter marinus TaxID=1431249 RepID=A0AA37WHJ0_9ALTE|nr:NAD(P)-dependent oxidoreductase [Agaribacter marinus]GLR70113.1 oxidoreductase [Agaribacter marinus]